MGRSVLRPYNGSKKRRASAAADALRRKQKEGHEYRAPTQPYKKLKDEKLFVGAGIAAAAFAA